MALIGYFVGGFATAHFALRVLVPFLMEIIGEKHFASRSAFDGCQAGLLGGIVAMGAWLVGERSTSQELLLLVFPFIAFTCTLCGLLYLRWLGSLDGVDKARDWNLVDGHVPDRTGEEIHPTCYLEESIYNQTGPFSGYAQYFLTLADADNEQALGTNSYNSEDDFKRDRSQIQQLPNIKWLDLIWLWRAEEKRWLVVYIPVQWTPFLSGPLDRLSVEDQVWWHQWLFPEFAKHIGVQVDGADAWQRFERFKEAYGGDSPDEEFIHFERKLRTLLESQGPVIAVDSEAYHELQRSVAGSHPITSIETGSDFITLKSELFE